MNNNIECDTSILKDTAKKVLDDCADFETKINNFFSKINSMAANGEWTGQNSKDYSNLVIQDKEDFLKYIEGIKDIAKQLESFSEDMDDTMRKNEAECQW